MLELNFLINYKYWLVFLFGLGIFSVMISIYHLMPDKSNKINLLFITVVLITLETILRIN